ncbi:MAG: HlyD family efflux transporter periplasmic adaptor subunit [Xanthomonadales bacterium]|nr:HlyD family efflux transporter periplasmic adaptor subunit [Xanthomonadales bacterium]NIX12190.1 HlyD family efflux transporter periplasmic adaptor subunit [Xanthomonadales bacterium]
MPRQFLIAILSSLSVLLFSAALPAEESTPLLTGQVFSRKAQDIIVPLTSNWQSRIDVLAPEGSYVETGQLVVEFDGTEAARQLEQQRESQRTARAVAERDLARLEKELAQAEYQLEQSRVTLSLATMRADIPEGLIGSLEYSENQLARETSVKNLEDAEKNLEDKREALAERRTQAEMDMRKVELQEAWWEQMAESFVIRAQQPGYVIHQNHPHTRAKFQEGDSVRTSYRIAQVADTSDLAIKVWINSVDKPRIELGTAVRVTLDALPDRVLPGRLESILDSGSKRGEWGDAVYFEGVVVLDELPENLLMPGMSALVEFEQ